MQTQNRLFSICVSKMVIYTYKKKIASTNQAFLSFSQQNCNLRWQNGNLSQQNIFLYYYFLLSYNKLQWQMKLIIWFLYFIIRNNARYCSRYTYELCHVCHLQREAKRRKVIAQKQLNTLNQAQSSNLYLFHVDVQNKGIGSQGINQKFWEDHAFEAFGKISKAS